jgi:hypothetical protein
MDDVVKTRADQNIDQQYGRDNVYACSPDAKPLKPEQPGSRDTNIFGTMKTYAAEAWHKTEGFAAAAWNKTTGLFTHHDGSGAVAQVEPQPAAGPVIIVKPSGQNSVCESDDHVSRT